jgi:hypothetical protein
MPVKTAQTLRSIEKLAGSCKMSPAFDFGRVRQLSLSGYECHKTVP